MSIFAHYVNNYVSFLTVIQVISCQKCKRETPKCESHDQLGEQPCIPILQVITCNQDRSLCVVQISIFSTSRVESHRKNISVFRIVQRNFPHFNFYRILNNMPSFETFYYISIASILLWTPRFNIIQHFQLQPYTIP